MVDGHLGYEKPKTPENESERLATLQSYFVLDTEAERSLDNIIYLASEICGTPVALISLIDSDRQWFKARLGVDATETPRDLAFCAHAINDPRPLVVPDSLLDSRFAGNPLVQGGPKVRFYAGAQLRAPNGSVLGTLCVIDQKPRELSEGQIKALEILADQVMTNFERRKLERTLIDRDRFLNNILAALPDVVTYVDKDYRLQYVNPSFEKWFHSKAAGVQGKHISDVKGLPASERGRLGLQNTLAGYPQEYQLTVTSGQGDTRQEKTIWVISVPDIQEDGKVLGAFTIMRDITAIKNTERLALLNGRELELALKEVIKKESIQRAIFDNAPLGIMKLNAKFQFIKANAAYCHMVGHSETELKGMSLKDIIPSASLRDAQNSMTLLTQGTATSFHVEENYLSKSGKVFMVSTRLRKVNLGSEGEHVYIGVVEDVSEARAKEQKLKDAEARMITSAKMAELGEMAAGVAHEINNPLAIIQGKAEYLRIKIENGAVDMTKFDNDLKVVVDTTDRIARIVKGLRHFSRNGDGDPMTPSSVAQILENTLSLCREKLNHNAVKVDLSCPPDLTVECKSTQISQIVMNLISNAHDAIEKFDDKWISIHVTQVADRVRIAVTDSGTGIPSPVAQKIMQPFYTTKEIGKGTGLGLSISKGIAEEHKGSLHYDPTKKNTTFILELPISVSSLQAA